MNALFTAIYNKFDGDATLKAALTGGMWNTKVPTSRTDPYAVYNLMSNIPNGTFTEDIEEFVYQFNIFLRGPEDGKSAADVTAIYEQLIAVYDDCSLTVTGYTHVHTTREFSTLLYVDGKWQYNVRYRTEIQKN